MRRSALVSAMLLATVALPAAAATTPRVAIETTDGTIVVALDPVHAPVTTRNFLAYVDAHAYDNTSFYRTVRAEFGQPRPGIEIIQGGLHEKPGARAPIAVEKTTSTGIRNTDATISMARTSDPNSATSEFFINIGDNSMLDADRFSDQYGYAAFGRVVRGMDVVTKIQHAPAQGQSLTPPVRIVRIRRLR